MTLRFMITSGLFGALLLGAALAFWRWLPRRRDAWKRLPRERRVGAALGVACLIWSAYLALPLLEGPLAGLRRLLPILVVALAVGGFMYLDYVFTRALGGLATLAIVFLLHEAFVAHAVLRPLYALVMYLIGAAGLWIIAHPYRFRDLLEKGSESPRCRQLVCGALTAAGVVAIVIPLVTHVL